MNTKIIRIFFALFWVQHVHALEGRTTLNNNNNYSEDWIVYVDSDSEEAVETQTGKEDHPFTTITQATAAEFIGQASNATL